MRTCKRLVYHTRTEQVTRDGKGNGAKWKFVRALQEPPGMQVQARDNRTEQRAFTDTVTESHVYPCKKVSYQIRVNKVASDSALHNLCKYSMMNRIRLGFLLSCTSTCGSDARHPKR
jgi:hypothetical protein